MDGTTSQPSSMNHVHLEDAEEDTRMHGASESELTNMSTNVYTTLRRKQRTDENDDNDEPDPSSITSLQCQKSEPSQHTRTEGGRQRDLWRIQNRKILLTCSLIILPMVAFTVTILWLIFGHKLRGANCLYQELCPKNGTFNQMNAGSHYYVDFPAARLVFVASWSSTISFSLIGALMAIYSYAVAYHFLRLSSGMQPTTSYPTPYQTSMLLRVLNAEMTTLYDLISLKLKEVFWNRKKHDGTRQAPQILQFAVVVLFLAVSGSLLIQAADTYLHIATEAIDFVQVLAESNTSHPYSRGLAPWCLNRPTSQSSNNANFWGCAFAPDSGQDIVIYNYSQTSAMNSGVSTEHDVLDFVDTDGMYIAVLGANNTDRRIDWKASSFGVSTQCQAVRNDSCDISGPVSNDHYGNISAFSCTKDRAGFEVSGNIFSVQGQAYFFDFHQFVQEPPPFESTNTSSFATETMQSRAANLSEQDAHDVFRNPWHWLASVDLRIEPYSRFPAVYTDTRIWDPSTLMLYCNTTVWDLNYTAIGSHVTSVTRKPSNSSTTGIVSMVTAQMWGYSNSMYLPPVAEANLKANNMEEYSEIYSRRVSGKFLIPMAAQAEARPALLVQSRMSKVISKVPKMAVWILVVANLLFAFFAVSLTILALMVTSKDVYQLRTRMSVTGLAAQLFEGTYAQRKVKDDEDLFEEHEKKEDRHVKRVGVENLSTGGTRFEILDG